MTTTRAAGLLSWRDCLAIARHEIMCAWIVACDMRDRPHDITDDHIDRLATAIRRLDALRRAT